MSDPDGPRPSGRGPLSFHPPSAFRSAPMLIVTRAGITEPELAHICERVESLGLRTHVSRGQHRVVIGCVGEEAVLAGVPPLALPGVESVTPVQKPYPLASRDWAADPARATT